VQRLEGGPALAVEQQPPGVLGRQRTRPRVAVHRRRPQNGAGRRIERARRVRRRDPKRSEQRIPGRDGAGGLHEPEAATIDGAGMWRAAWHIQIPMIRKWIAHMAILAFAGGTQLFVEPQLLRTASLGRIDPTWSPNQLAYVYAFQHGDFNGAAAISLVLLVLGLLCAGLLVTRSGLFKADEK